MGPAAAGAPLEATGGAEDGAVGAGSVESALSLPRLMMFSVSLVRELSGDVALSTEVLTAAAAVPAHSTPISDATVIHLVCMWEHFLGRRDWLTVQT